MKPETQILKLENHQFEPQFSSESDETDETSSFNRWLEVFLCPSAAPLVWQLRTQSRRLISPAQLNKTSQPSRNFAKDKSGSVKSPINISTLLYNAYGFLLNNVNPRISPGLSYSVYCEIITVIPVDC